MRAFLALLPAAEAIFREHNQCVLCTDNSYVQFDMARLTGSGVNFVEGAPSDTCEIAKDKRFPPEGKDFNEALYASIRPEERHGYSFSSRGSCEDGFEPIRSEDDCISAVHELISDRQVRENFKYKLIGWNQGCFYHDGWIYYNSASVSGNGAKGVYPLCVRTFAVGDKARLTKTLDFMDETGKTFTASVGDSLTITNEYAELRDEHGVELWGYHASVDGRPELASIEVYAKQLEASGDESPSSRRSTKFSDRWVDFDKRDYCSKMKYQAESTTQMERFQCAQIFCQHFFRSGAKVLMKCEEKNNNVLPNKESSASFDNEGTAKSRCLDEMSAMFAGLVVGSVSYWFFVLTMIGCCAGCGWYTYRKLIEKPSEEDEMHRLHENDFGPAREIEMTAQQPSYQHYSAGPYGGPGPYASYPGGYGAGY